MEKPKMLVLNPQSNEVIEANTSTCFIAPNIQANQVTLAIEPPQDISILREKLNPDTAV
jgi:sRNA-binding carbon storage regulator CsrA